ncbi:MAG: metallophosphoesterase family protein, partial [Treponemataceae bacterium]|nr:metallophosphoesterase family protein [Treponemataceae bacterium]
DTKGLAAALNEVKHLITGVRGNCDSEVDQMMLEFPVLAPYTTVLVPGSAVECGMGAKSGAKTLGSGADASCPSAVRRIFVHHGHLMTAEEAARLNPVGTVIVSGHTHVPVLERFSLRDAQTGAPEQPTVVCAPTVECGVKNADAANSSESCASSSFEGARAADYIALNPGSISIPKGGSEPGYAVIEVAAHGMEIRLCTLGGKVLKILESS